MTLHPIMAAAIRPFIEPAPECYHCGEPVCDDSVQEFLFGDPQPAHKACVERAEEAASCL